MIMKSYKINISKNLNKIYVGVFPVLAGCSSETINCEYIKYKYWI